MIDAKRRDQLAREFAGFLPREDRVRHPTYWAICRAIAADPQLLAMADAVPPPQLRVNVFLASVHELLLGGAEHALAHRYRSVCRYRGIEYEAVPDAQLHVELASFCELHRDALAARCASRATQTNEVGRSAALRAALATTGGRPVALLDAGCSAGLNLLVDAYRVEYGAMGVGPAGGPRLVCELRGAVPPVVLPAIEARVGLDLHPLDVASPADHGWLLACLWPDDLERFERLESAARLAAERRDELVLLEGDMVDDLASAAAAADAEHLVVLNSWSAPYLPRTRRPQLTDAVVAVAAARPTTWIAMEFPSVLAELGLVDESTSFASRAASAVCVTTFTRGRPVPRVVAEVHHHGRWLDWRTDADGAGPTTSTTSPG